MKLDINIIDEAKETNKALGAILGKIEERMQYVIEYCLKEINGKLHWWEWKDDDFFESLDEDVLQIGGEWTKGDEMLLLDKDGDEWSLQWGEFPLRWLFEDFEQEYTDGLKAYAEKERLKTEEKKADKKNKEKEKKILIESAKKKLTVKERKVLGL